MKERPILFGGDMVRAILDGRKTQTRRLATPQPDWINPDQHGNTVAKIGPRAGIARHLCPYGRPGDLLWVRETWQAIHVATDCETGLGEDWRHSFDIPPAATDYWTIVFAADPCHESSREERGFPWRPAIHMPRWASRITLRITDVRIERLQDITAADAAAEGVQIPVGGSTRRPMLDISSPYAPCHYLTADQARTFAHDAWLRAHFASLWDSMYAKRGNGWAANPAVWVIGFEAQLAAGRE